jgi:polyisoprenoid-binding protein YceI
LIVDPVGGRGGTVGLRAHWKACLVGAVLLVAVLAIGGPFVYARYLAPEAAAPLSVGTPQPAAPVGQLATAYTVGPGSEAGYRVSEVLTGQRIDAVGRTSDVTGSVQTADTRVTAGEITVDMRTVKSDQSRRDEYFTGDLMETGRYPNAVFTLTQPVDLGAEFTSSGPVTVDATGTLTVKDVTREVTFPLTAVRDGDTIGVSGAVPVTFTDFGIEPPSFGDFVKVDPTGRIEFLLVLSPAG